MHFDLFYQSFKVTMYTSVKVLI